MNSSVNTSSKLKQSSATSADHWNFSELIQILRLRRKLLYTFTILAVLGTCFRQVFYVPLYSGQVSLTIQKIENSPLQMALANLGTTQIDSSDRLKKYLDYIQSNEFFLAVAENLKFQEGYHRLNLTPPSELSIVHKKFWKQFFSTHFGRTETEQNSIRPEPVLVPIEELASILASMTQAESVGSDTIRIRITTLDSFTSMVVVNTAAQIFVKKTSERDYNEVTEVKRFIQDQLVSTTERLKRSEATLVDFKKRHNIISINAEHSSFSTKISGIESDLESTKLKFQENQKLIEYYQKTLANQENALIRKGSAGVQSSQSSVTKRLRMELDNLRYKKVLMETQGYAESSWQMSEVNREIDRVADLLKHELDHPEADGASSEEDEVNINPELARSKIQSLKNENKALDAKLTTIEKSRGELLKALGSLPSDEQVLLTLTRDVDLQFELYSSLKKKLQEVEIQQVALQSHVSIAERSGLPGPVARTNFVVKLLFALLVGMFLGSSTAFLFEAVDPTIKHPSELERMELVTLGSIPHVAGSPMRQTLGLHSYRPDLLICKEKPESPESMAFKHVRAQISTQHASDGSLAKVIVITSPERGDGKSFVSSNLAVSFSQLEKKTLLLDCDFRNPSVPWLFGYKEGDGLSSVLTMRASLDDVLIYNRLPYLDILPAGWVPPNPTELLSNDKFRVLLEHLRGIYDYIVIDSPPAVPVVDASVLASSADTVILTASFRKTKKNYMLTAVKKILQVSNKHIYALLNNVWEIHEYSSYDYLAGQEVARGYNSPDSKSELDQFEEALRKRKAG